MKKDFVNEGYSKHGQFTKTQDQNVQLTSDDSGIVQNPNEMKQIIGSDCEQCMKELITQNTTRLEELYQTAVATMKTAPDILAYKSALDTFQSLNGYKDSDYLAEKCQRCITRLNELKEINDVGQRFEERYRTAVLEMNKAEDVFSYRKAMTSFKRLEDYRDSEQLAGKCQREIDRLTQEEKWHVETQREELYRTAVSNMKKADSVQQYERVRVTFEELGGYKSSRHYAEKCQEEIDRLRFLSNNKTVGDVIGINENQRKWTIASGNKVFDYNELISFELIEDGVSIASGGVGRAVVGGILFGGAGAVVGALTPKNKKQKCTWLSIRITVNRSASPMEEIVLINYSVNKDSPLYREKSNTAREIMSLLEYICKQNDTQNNG